MAILIIQHGGETLSLGRLGPTLRDHGHTLIRVRPDVPPEEGGGLPSDLDEIDGVISMGGAANPTQNEPWMQAERSLLQQAHAQQLPVLGVCLGAQLLAQALGGEVGSLEAPEWGFEPVEINPTGHTDTLLAGIRWNAPQFHCHAQHVTTPPSGGTVLASSKATPIQAFSVGLRTYGIQYHFECDRPMITDLLADGGESLAASGKAAEQIEKEADAAYTEYARLGDRLCLNLASYLFTVADRVVA